MITFLLYFLMPKFQSISAQFPNHFDLQKVGEVKFNHEKYNVLRPTLHVVQDYFHDFMIRRDTNDFPTKRVFIDDNGFRHYWSGFEKAEKNLRKSDTLINQSNKTNIISDNTTNNVTDANNEHERHSNTTTRKLPKRKKKLKAIPQNILKGTENLREGLPGKTIAKTSFFCPFFGVVTMTTLLD